VGDRHLKFHEIRDNLVSGLMNDWMRTLAPILEDSNMELAGQPETGELLQIVRPD